MTTFNFYNKNGTKEVFVENPIYQFNFTEGDDIKYESDLYKIKSIVFHVSENKIERVIQCEVNM